MSFLNRLPGHDSASPTDHGSAAPCTIIDVTPVSPAENALAETSYKNALENLLGRPPQRFVPTEVPRGDAGAEACTQYHGELVADVHCHPVVAATHLAFKDHRPLTLSPDILWLLVAQGFANHVNAKSEKLRPTLVQHSGNVGIEVRRDDFIKGSPENPWPEVFDEFSRRIREHIGATTHELLLPNFSTTGSTERAAAQVVLLDALQSFFTYSCRTKCGIPQIRLGGTADDWAELAERVRGLGRFGLEWWISVLGPIVDQFVMASKGVVDTHFWQSIYKLEALSGGLYTTGWLNAFFPYLQDQKTGRASRENSWLVEGGQRLQDQLSARIDNNWWGNGPTMNDFPGGLARTPFQWICLETSFSMEFLGGFVGVRQDSSTLALRPEIGWAVREVV